MIVKLHNRACDETLDSASSLDATISAQCVMRRSLITCAVIGVAVVVLSFVSIPRHRETREEHETQTYMATVWVLSLVGWIALFDAVVGFETLLETPLVMAGFAWPMLLLGFDIMMLSHQTFAHESKRVKSSMQLDSNAISGLAFAMAGVFATNFGKEFAKSASPILTVVSLICLSFIAPNPGVQSDSVPGIVLSSVQKVSLLFCVGLLSSALCINISATMQLKTGILKPVA